MFKSNTKPNFEYCISLMCDCAHEPQHAPKMHFRCAIITHLEHNYLQRTLMSLIPLTVFYKHFPNK